MGFWDQVQDKVVDGAEKQAASGENTGWTKSGSAEGIDVDAVLAKMAAGKGGGGNYKTSIVDLLILLDLDSSLGARKELAAELGVNAGDPGSAEQNIALHKAVLKQFADKGATVSSELKG